MGRTATRNGMELELAVGSPNQKPAAAAATYGRAEQKYVRQPSGSNLTVEVAWYGRAKQKYVRQPSGSNLTVEVAWSLRGGTATRKQPRS